MSINRLSASQCKRVTGQRVQLCDGAGLWFHRLENGDAYFSFRYRSPVSGKDRSYGIGPAGEGEKKHTYTLSKAREAAAACRLQIKGGIDPLEARKARKAAEAAKRKTAEQTFRKVAEKYVEAHTAGLSNLKAKAQWASSMEAYVYPKIGSMPVMAISRKEIELVFDQPHNGSGKPIREAIPETASRVRQRIEAILTYAKNMGYRTGDNPATKDVLPKRSTKKKLVKHHTAIPYDEVPAFMRKLEAAKGVAALALRWTILTAARTGETTGATWSEIDIEAKTWVISASRMKAGKAHKVPLSEAAMAIIEAVKPYKRGHDKPLFPSPSVGSLSNMTMMAVIKRLERSETVHGMRSALRDWAAETTTYPREIAEAALAHTVGGVEGAYRRGDLFAKRRQLMADWAAFCLAPTELNEAAE